MIAWGAAVAGMGLVRSIGPAMAILALAGYADGVSAFCRSAINQTVTPDELRGRMSAVYSLVVTSGPRLGDIESGLVAGVTSAATSVATGGVACILGAGAIMLALPALPALAAYNGHSTAASRSQRASSKAPATESGASSEGQ